MSKDTIINKNFTVINSEIADVTYINDDEIIVNYGTVEITGTNCKANVIGKGIAFTHKSGNVLRAMHAKAKVVTYNSGSIAYAVVDKAIAESRVEGAYATAMVKGAKARSFVKGAIAEAAESGAIAEAMCIGAITTALMDGAIKEDNFKIPKLSKDILNNPLFAAVAKLSKDVMTAAVDFGAEEARILVKTYYQKQEERKRSANQLLELYTNNKPHTAIQFVNEMNVNNEKFIKGVLDSYTASHPIGIWLRSHHGIGPVIAAGLLANIDIKKCPTAGHIWSYAGYVPDLVWLGTEGATKLVKQHAKDTEGKARDINEVIMLCCSSVKRNYKNFNVFLVNKGLEMNLDNLTKWLSMPPWNADLKRLCFIIGQCFMKNSNHPDCHYGHLYREYKLSYTAKNINGDYKDQANRDLDNKKYSESTESIKVLRKGMLPAAQIDARARRKCVSIFLAHLHEVWYISEFGKMPPNPYPIEMGHAHKIEVPLNMKPSDNNEGDDIDWHQAKDKSDD